jgi:hypothetical protein
MKRSFSIVALLALVGSIGLAGCGDDDAEATPPECEEIAERCHDLDPGSGPIHECHESAETGTAASCTEMRAMCFAVCVADADAGM